MSGRVSGKSPKPARVFKFELLSRREGDPHACRDESDEKVQIFVLVFKNVRLLVSDVIAQHLMWHVVAPED